MNAAMCGHAGLIGVLIAADPSMEHLRMRDNGGKMAVDRAVENGRDECVALLKAAEKAAAEAVAAASSVGGAGGVSGAGGSVGGAGGAGDAGGSAGGSVAGDGDAGGSVGGAGGAGGDGGAVYDGPPDALYEMCCSWSPLSEESMATVMELIHTGIDVRYQVSTLD